MGSSKKYCGNVRNVDMNGKLPYIIKNMEPVVQNIESEVKMNSNNISVGNSGEYFVAGELERHGFTVAVPMSNTKDFDILAINRTTFKQYAIQVKTTKLKKKQWTLGKKNETLIGDNIIYFMVSLNDLEVPEYHIIPSKIVAETIKQDHNNWLNTLGLKGQKHNDNNIRIFNDKEDKYLNRWDFLE